MSMDCTRRTSLVHQLLELFHRKGSHVLDAGFALKTHGSFVKGLTPLRAGLAGRTFNFKFNKPAILKEPDFFNWSAPKDMKPSTASFTFFGFKSRDSATLLYTLDADIAVPFIAFIAFMAPPVCS